MQTACGLATRTLSDVAAYACPAHGYVPSYICRRRGGVPPACALRSNAKSVSYVCRRRAGVPPEHCRTSLRMHALATATYLATYADGGGACHPLCTSIAKSVSAEQA